MLRLASSTIKKTIFVMSGIVEVIEGREEDLQNYVSKCQKIYSDNDIFVLNEKWNIICKYVPKKLIKFYNKIESIYINPNPKINEKSIFNKLFPKDQKENEKIKEAINILASNYKQYQKLAIIVFIASLIIFPIVIITTALLIPILILGWLGIVPGGIAGFIIGFSPFLSNLDSFSAFNQILILGSVITLAILLSIINVLSFMAVVGIIGMIIWPLLPFEVISFFATLCSCIKMYLDAKDEKENEKQIIDAMNKYNKLKELKKVLDQNLLNEKFFSMLGIEFSVENNGKSYNAFDYIFLFLFLTENFKNKFSYEEIKKLSYGNIQNIKVKSLEKPLEEFLHSSGEKNGFCSDGFCSDLLNNIRKKIN